MTSTTSGAADPREQFEAFEALLREEQRTLLEGDYGRLNELTRQKLALLQGIQSAVGVVPGQSLEESLRDLALPADLRDLIRRAHETKRANGRLIAGAQDYVREALNVLRGPAAEAYDARGNTGGACAGRLPLGRA